MRTKNSRLATPSTKKITHKGSQDPLRVIFYVLFYLFVLFRRSYLRIFPRFPQCHHQPEDPQPKQDRRFDIEDAAD
jgi:hypothetical protein